MPCTATIASSSVTEGSLADQTRVESIRASTAIEGIDELMRAGSPEPVSVPFILHLHRCMFEHSGG